MTQGSVQISNAEYHKHFAVSASMIKVMDKHGPRAYWNSFLNPDRPEKKSTPALILGSLTHAAILEPEDLDNQITVVSSRTTKKGKEETAEAEKKGMTAVTNDQWDLAMAMRESVHREKEATDLLATGAADTDIAGEITACACLFFIAC